MNYKQQIDRRISEIDEARSSDDKGETITNDDIFDVAKLLYRLYKSDNDYFKNIAFRRMQLIEDEISSQMSDIIKHVNDNGHMSNELLANAFAKKSNNLIKKDNNDPLLSRQGSEQSSRSRDTGVETFDKKVSRIAKAQDTVRELFRVPSNDEEFNKENSNRRNVKADTNTDNQKQSKPKSIVDTMISPFKAMMSFRGDKTPENTNSDAVGILMDIRNILAKPNASTQGTSKQGTPTSRLLSFISNTHETKFNTVQDASNDGNHKETNTSKSSRRKPTTRKDAYLPLLRAIDNNTIALIDITTSIDNTLAHSDSKITKLDRNGILGFRLINRNLSNVSKKIGIMVENDTKNNKNKDQKKKFDEISESRKKIKQDSKTKKSTSASPSIFSMGGANNLNGMLEQIVSKCIKAGLTTLTRLIPVVGELAATSAGVAALGLTAMVLPGNMGESGKYHTLDEFGLNGKPMDEDAKAELKKINDYKKKQDDELMANDSYRNSVESMKSWSDYRRRQKSLGIPYQDPKLIRQHKIDQGGEDEVSMTDTIRNMIPKAPQRPITTPSGNAMYKTPTGDDPVLNSVFDHIVKKESAGGNNFDKDGNILTSKKGALGAMQVMPATAKSPGYKIDPAKDDSVEEYNRVGTDYIKTMYKRYNGDVEKTMASYNMGPRALERVVQEYGDDWRSHIPKETRDYIDFDSKTNTSKLNIAKSENTKPKLELSDNANDVPKKLMQIPTPANTQGHQFVNNMSKPTPTNNTTKNINSSPTIVNAPTSNVNNTTIGAKSITTRNDEFSLRRIIDGYNKRSFI